MAADLLAILNQAGYSLGTQRGLASVASHNIENANTPGYSRQSAVVTAIQPNDFVNGQMIGGGAEITGIQQARDTFLEYQLPAAFGQAARSSAESGVLGQVSDLDPSATNGVGSALSQFYAQLQQLSQNPGDPGLRQTVVGQAQTLTQAFKTTSQSLEANRSAVDTQIAALVPQVNTLSTQLASLNQQIINAAASSTPNDLMDQRQQVVDQMEQLTGGHPIPDAKGNISFGLADGTTLVSGVSSATLVTTPDSTNGNHLKLQIKEPGAVIASDLPGAIGGQIGGLIDARDGALKTAETQLDGLAFDFANTVNTAHQAGFALDGTTTGQNFFDLGGLVSSTGAAAAISVSAPIVADPSLIEASSTAAGVPGDNGALLGMINTETAALPSSGASAEDTVSNMTAQFGSSVTNAQAISDHDAAWSSNLTQMRQSYSGVSIDEELINMQTAQTGYQAVARIITTAQTMLDTLMALKE